MNYWTRETWLKAGTAPKRRQWAKETPLAWVLEYQPTILLPGKGLVTWEPWPFQQEFMQSLARFRAINKPRQCGISTTAAAEAAWEFDNIPGSVIVIISKDHDAAINFHKYIYNILYSVRRNNPNAPKLLKTNERETTNAINSRIVSLAASKESGRSFSATHLFFDELAFIVYAQDIWQAANATLSQTGGRVTAISTPKGKANLFYRIFSEPKNMGFTTFSFGWWDVPTYNPFFKQYSEAESAWEKKKWIDRARKEGQWYREERPKYTELAWRQEFEGAFDASAGAVFSTRQLKKGFKRNWLKPMEDPRGILTEWYTDVRGVKPGHFYACGIDLGRKNDPSVVITYDYTNRPAQVVDFKYIEAGRADWELIIQLCLEHLKKWRPDAVHDGIGSGDAVTEALFGYSEPFFSTKSLKQNIVERTQHAFDYEQVRLPILPHLYREHQEYEWDDKDLIQDCVMANAMAISIFYEPQTAALELNPDFDFVGAAR